VYRYIAVCRPFHRRIICTRTFARRAIATVLLLAALVSIHKPLLSGVYDVSATGDLSTAETPAAAADDDDGRVTPASRESARDDNDSLAFLAAGSDDDVGAMSTSTGDGRVCGRNPASQSSFITDIVYGLSITVVPFVPITVRRP